MVFKLLFHGGYDVEYSTAKNPVAFLLTSMPLLFISESKLLSCKKLRINVMVGWWQKI